MGLPRNVYAWLQAQLTTDEWCSFQQDTRTFKEFRDRRVSLPPIAYDAMLEQLGEECMIGLGYIRDGGTMYLSRASFAVLETKFGSEKLELFGFVRYPFERSDQVRFKQDHRDDSAWSDRPYWAEEGTRATIERCEGYGCYITVEGLSKPEDNFSYFAPADVLELVTNAGSK